MPTTAPQPPHRLRHGFTLIEMLIVIGILLLLIGMSVVGFSAVSRHSRTQHTKGVLEAAKSMLGEFEATAGKQNQASFRSAWDGFAAIDVTHPSPVPDSWRRGQVGGGPMTWEGYSAMVLAKLLELPNNKAIFDKLPTDQVQKTLNINGVYYYELLDGYGHPLLFVPSSGLVNVVVNGRLGDPNATKGHLQNDGRVTAAGGTAPNPRYFWMSAGLDNDPQTGDDNHYSFEQ